MDISNENRDKVLSAIMKRYNGLSGLHTAMSEDEDVVLINISDDINDVIPELEILEIMHQMLA